MANFYTACCQLLHNPANDHHRILIPVCGYFGASAIALANKTIGQTAMDTIIPKAISSDK